MLLRWAELLYCFLERTSRLPNEILSVVTSLKNKAPASASFFYFERFSWVRPKRLANRGKLFAFVSLDQQPLYSHSFTFQVEVRLSSLPSSSIVQTSLFALQSEGTYSEVTLQEATLKYTWSYYLLNKLF